MKRYSTIMSVLLTLALPIAATSADTPAAPEKAAPAAESAKPAAKPEAAAPAGHPTKSDKVDAVKKSMSKNRMGQMLSGSTTGAEGAAVNPSGKVLETMKGGGYAYALLEEKGTKTWVAFTPVEVHVGDTLTFQGCMEMKNFQSKALNRTFESVLFCGEPDVKFGPNAMKGKKSPGSGGATPTASGKIKVDKAEGPNAYTVADLFAKKAALNGKQVVVKGQVVKAASGIMNKTWLHIQDGSGSEKKKNHDIVVTTTENAEIGNVVTVTGILAKDKDFGSGYKYDVIIEKAHLKK